MKPVAALVMIVGIFAWVMRSATARAFGLKTKPVRKRTLSRSTSSSASCLARPGLRSEERRVGKECRSRCDWSSDVCSSDLIGDGEGVRAEDEAGQEAHLVAQHELLGELLGATRIEIGRASCRERV